MKLIYLSSCLSLGLLFCAAGWGPSSFAQSPSNSSPSLEEQPTSEPTFVVSQFVLKGPALLPRERLFEVLKGFESRPISFSDLRLLTTSLEKLHALAGYEVVRVVIPEQDLLPKGALTLEIVEAKLEGLSVEGAKAFEPDWVLSQLPSLQPGLGIRTPDMDKNIRLLGSNPALNAVVSLEPGLKPRTVDATVQVSEPAQTDGFFLTLDNTGSKATGDFRAGLVYQNNNVHQLGHQFVGQVVSSPGHWSDVKVFSFAYKVPVPQFNTRFELAYTDSSVDAGTLDFGGLSLSVQGSGSQLAFRSYTYLDRMAGLDSRLVVSYELKEFDSEVVLNGSGQSLVPDVRSHPVGLGLHLSSLDSPFQRDFKLMAFSNLGAAGEPFDLVRGHAHLSDHLAQGWRYRLAVDFQHTSDSLVSGEQFGAGGMLSVRGFNERAVSKDKGYRISFEAQSPNQLSDESVSREVLSARWLKSFNYVFFVEGAALRASNFSTDAEPKQHIASVGFGLRFQLEHNQHIRLDLARVVSGITSEPKGDVMLHLSYVLAL